jgi:hypothetical protein
MANSIKQSFLNTLFQWTVRTTAAEPKKTTTAAEPTITTTATTTTADPLQPMSEDVTIRLTFRHNISMYKLFFRVKNG